MAISDKDQTDVRFCERKLAPPNGEASFKQIATDDQSPGQHPPTDLSPVHHPGAITDSMQMAAVQCGDVTHHQGHSRELDEECQTINSIPKVPTAPVGISKKVFMPRFLVPALSGIAGCDLVVNQRERDEDGCQQAPQRNEDRQFVGVARIGGDQDH